MSRPQPPLPRFEPLDSIPDRWRSGLVTALLLLFAACWVGVSIVSLLLPWLDPDESLAMYIALPAVTWGPMIFVLLRYRSAPRTPRHDAMRIDEAGVHWLSRGAVIRSLPWQDLCRARHSGVDVVVRTQSGHVRGARISHDVLEVQITGKGGSVAEELPFLGGRATASWFRNVGALRARFLLGVRTFRPDIRIDDAIYGAFFIDRDTFRFNAKSLLLTWLVGLGIAALVVGGTVLYLTRAD